MRGRFSAATWLFAALAAGLLVVGARAPQPRESAATQAARARLKRQTSELAPTAEDTSFRPEQGCLRDRTTGEVYRRNEQGEWTASGPVQQELNTGVVVTVTPCCDEADPSGRDFALAELANHLRTQWQIQAAHELTPATVIYVSRAEPEFSWARWQTLLLSDLSPVVDDLCHAAADVWDACGQHWLWTELLAWLSPLETPADSALDDLSFPTPVFSELLEPGERVERSVLVRSGGQGYELVEREERSVLILR